MLAGIFLYITEVLRNVLTLKPFWRIPKTPCRNYFYPLHLEPVNFYGDDVGIYDVELPNAERLAQVGGVQGLGSGIRV